jgi:hypothetical protein
MNIRDIHLEIRSTSLLFCLDEAQVLLETLPMKFQSPHSGESRSLFSKILYCWTKLRGVFIEVAGTSLRLTDAVKLVASSVLKSEATFTEQLVFVDFGTYKNTQQLGQYLERYLGPIDSKTIRRILNIVKGTKRANEILIKNILGRYRYSSYFLSLILTEQTDKLAMSKEGIIERALVVSRKSCKMK